MGEFEPTNGLRFFLERFEEVIHKILMDFLRILIRDPQQSCEMVKYSLVLRVYWCT